MSGRHAVGVTADIAIDGDAVVERLDLGNGAWVDIARGWLAGADEVF
ncbi:MAG: hypothetical protein QOD38_518, partial [Acidimicrobiaceae bacterium]